MKAPISDSRITLRPFHLHDAPRLHEATVETMDELLSWMTWCRKDYSLEDCQRFIAGAESDWNAQSSYNFVILNKDEPGLFGSISLNRIDRHHHSANVSYWVRSSQSGSGVATRALGLVAHFGLVQLQLNRLEILVPAGNIASQRVAQKAGAQLEGVLRKRLHLQGKIQDAVMYSLVNADLPPR